jgi:hypothetical protein
MKRGPGHVYFMRPVGMAGPVKIGFSRQCDERLIALSIWSPFPLEIAAKVPGTLALEGQFHSYLLADHSHCEWFHPTTKVLETVAAVSAGTFDFSVLDGLRKAKPRNYPPEARKAFSLQMRLYWATRGDAAPAEITRAARHLDFRKPDELAANTALIENWLGERKARLEQVAA